MIVKISQISRVGKTGNLDWEMRTVFFGSKRIKSVYERCTWYKIGTDGVMNNIEKYSLNCFREAEAAGSTPVAPTIYLTDIAALIPRPSRYNGGAGQCAPVRLSLPTPYICGVAA